jgi:hypothetical protein
MGRTKERPGREGAGAKFDKLCTVSSATCSIAKCPTPSFSASGTRSITRRRLNTFRRSGTGRTSASGWRKRCGRSGTCR